MRTEAFAESWLRGTSCAAKDKSEAAMAGRSRGKTRMGWDDISAETRLKIVEALQLGNRLEAIRLYREATGCDLAEATWFVDELERRGPLGATEPVETSFDSAGSGCLGVLCVAIVLVVAIAFGA
ncbi:MAG: hypothetical protein D6725_11730 [Planctomycetota bacterium]|nr:MAG: hypothetical protein D6725_11730 [Planctomycetota bacterium]